MIKTIEFKQTEAYDEILDNQINNFLMDHRYMISKVIDIKYQTCNEGLNLLSSALVIYEVADK